MKLTVRSNANPRSSPAHQPKQGLAAKRQRYSGGSSAAAASHHHHRPSRKFGGARQWLMVGLAAGIVLLMIFQLTTMTQHTLDASTGGGAGGMRHRDHSDPLHHALREQRLEHLDFHSKQQRQISEAAAAAKAKEQRRRLNSTKGNSSRAEKAGMIAANNLQKAQPIPIRRAQVQNGALEGGSAKKPINRPLPPIEQLTPEQLKELLLNGSNAAGTRTERVRRIGLGHKLTVNVTDMYSRYANMTLIHGNLTGNMTGNVTGNMTKMIIATKKPRRPFQLRRSIPQAPPDFKQRTMPMDPLSPHFNISQLTPLNYKLKSKWHGVLLDAGRHYFEVDWIKRMIDILHILQYNCLHFRLTDDQAFNVKLDSQPDLAHHVGLFGNDKTYTPTELRELVAYAKTKNITIWPEINVPGHGGGWAGIPGLIVQCPEFICDKGYGVPINVTHPKFRAVLTDVLREVLDIFDNPPYLHLGGDEVDMAEPCFREFGQPMFNYDSFEASLQDILKEINYTDDRIIRWEMTGQRLNSPRTGKMPQYWFRIPGESAQDWGRNKFLASGGLYMDFNEMDMAWQIYLYTRRYYHLPRDNFPLGIIVGTFELDANFWYDRNVVGRLLAVTMGAAEDVYADDGKELYEMYHKACRKVGFDEALCDHYGLPFISWSEYRAKWTDVWTQWKGRICDRLTYPKPETVYVGLQERDSWASRYDQSATALKLFWEEFGTKRVETVMDFDSDEKFSALKHQVNLTALMTRLVPNSGIILDLTLPNQDGNVLGPRLQLVLQKMHALAFNLIQVRLANDATLGYRSDVVPYAMPQDRRNRPTIQSLNFTLVAEARRLGIGVIPEIDLTTNAGGWDRVGFNIPCPLFTCRKGHGIKDINHPSYAAVAYGLIREVGKIASSGMIHLGSDERKAAEECFAEVSDVQPLYEPFENKLAYLLQFDDLVSDQIIRWSNEEGVEYPGRLGSITQCRKGDCRSDSSTGKWIATVDLHVGGPYTIYSTTKELALRKPFAILAEVGSVDAYDFGKYHMLMRMLAFAMGVSDMKEWSRGMFEESFTQLCVAMFGSSNGCFEFARSDDGSDLAAARAEANRAAMCAERTRNVTRHIYRPEFQEKVATVEIQPN